VFKLETRPKGANGKNTLENGEFGSKPSKMNPSKKACFTLMKLFTRKVSLPVLAQEAFGKSFTKETLPGKVSSKFVIPLSRVSFGVFALLTAFWNANF